MIAAVGAKIRLILGVGGVGAGRRGFWAGRGPGALGVVGALICLGVEVPIK